ncbi:MAG TPA: ABC transporter ATP-binding protein [Acidimicrobiales bacterium]|nr:ABC transporter ATP-binding protein [Acidimicrobiales bacterium]
MAERISLVRLVKTYHGGNTALADVSLDVEPGTFLVLLGPSGSGKTTMLRCLAGIERVSSGRITIGSSVVAEGRVHLPPEQRNLSMVFQDYALWPHLVARDNVAFAMRRRGLSREECRRHAGAMLERVGLAALAERYPSELSGGEQQRVALARALVADTGLVLCDEPLSNLDADLRERMRIEISALVRQAGATTIYITHDQSEAFALADLVGVLEQGRLVQLGAPEEVYLRPATPFVARFTGLAGELTVRIGRHVAEGLVETHPPGEHCRPVVAKLGSAGGFGGTRWSGAPGGSGRAGGAAAGGATGAGGATAATRPGLLTIRPAAVQLRAVHEDDHHLTGVVSDVAFRGRGYEHAVRLADGSQVTGIFAERRVERGEMVGMRLDPGGCLVFPATSSEGDVTGAADARPASVRASDALHSQVVLAGRAGREGRRV